MFFGVQKHRFYPPKDNVWYAKSIAFTTQNLCFWIFNAHFWPNIRKFFSRWRKWFVTKKENQKCSQTLKKLRFESNLKGKRAKKWKGKLKRIKVKKWKGERVKKWLTPLHCYLILWRLHLFTFSPFYLFTFTWVGKVGQSR